MQNDKGTIYYLLSTIYWLSFVNIHVYPKVFPYQANNVTNMPKNKLFALFLCKILRKNTVTR